MTSPKDKAKELFDDFLDLMDIQYPPNAKYMAIRCVDEVLNKDGYNNDYWKEVKQELEKL